MSGSVSLPASSSQSSGKRAKDRRPVSLAVVPSRPGDHPATLQFLTTIFQGPSPAEFRASHEDPFFELRDRLLLKRAHQILGHAQITHRAMRLGRAVVPAAGLQWLSVAPQFRRQGFGELLLRRAEHNMAEDGHAMGILATSTPDFFHRFGWTPCGRRNRWDANVCQILSVLAAKGLYPKIRKPLDIRPLRRMEVAEIAQIYRINMDSAVGPLERPDAYWQWLVNRAAYDEFLVAIERENGRRPSQGPAALVGYAVLRGEHVAELLTLPDHNKAAIQLLSRACGEAIERGIDTLSVHLPPQHRLGRILKAAGGRCVDRRVQPGEVLMAKVVDPVTMLERMAAEFVHRARRSKLALPLDLGLAVDRDRYQLSIADSAAETRNGSSAAAVTVTAGSIGRSYLRLSSTQLTRLLLGLVDWDNATGIEASTKLAEQAGTALFARQRIWRPPLDDLRADG